MRSTPFILFTATLLVAGYLVIGPTTEEGPRSTEPDAPVASPVRDETGAVIESDPADDLGGYVRKSERSVADGLAVGERDLHFLELYGLMPGEQLEREYSLLKERYEQEASDAFDLCLERGEYVLVSGTNAARVPGRLSAARLLPGEDAISGDRRLVVLPPESYGGLYEMARALEWIDERLGN